MHHDLSCVRPLTNTEAAYIAGYLDGDGCISLQIKPRNKNDNRHMYHFHASISFADERIKVLDWINSKVNNLGYIERERTGARHLIYSANVARWMLPQIKPYLVLKDKQADLMIEFLLMTSSVKGGKIKTEMWLRNMRKYLDIYFHIRCLNHNIDYSLISKSGELLESHESYKYDSVVGNDERERYKKFIDLVTSSRPYCGCINYLRQWEGSTTRSEDNPPINSTAPDSENEKI